MKPLWVCVQFYDREGEPLGSSYRMDHNDPQQRKVLGEQIYNAFRAGQSVMTWPGIQDKE